ncbi:MAG: hypothetical protein J6V24_13340, partial [Clostridia bacterium]|nr:hypothetical protein [Clostridia bacterium]
MVRRWTAVLLCAAIFLTGCRKPESGHKSGSNPSKTEHDAADGVLEHVWTGTEYDLPEGWAVSEPLAYDPETAVIFAEAYCSAENGDREYALCTLTDKAYQLEPFVSEEDAAIRMTVTNAVRSGNTLWYVKNLNPGTTESKQVLVRRDTESGAEEEAALSALFEAGDSSFLGFLADADGDLWLSTYMHEIVAIRPDFSRIFSVRIDHGGKLLMRADGTVFFQTENPSGPVLAGIDK